MVKNGIQIQEILFYPAYLPQYPYGPLTENPGNCKINIESIMSVTF